MRKPFKSAKKTTTFDYKKYFPVKKHSHLPREKHTFNWLHLEMRENISFAVVLFSSVCTLFFLVQSLDRRKGCVKIIQCERQSSKPFYMLYILYCIVHRRLWHGNAIPFFLTNCLHIYFQYFLYYFISVSLF